MRWPSKGERKILRKCFFFPVFTTIVIGLIWGFFLPPLSTWVVVGIVVMSIFLVEDFRLAWKRYRRIVSNPLIYAWFAAEEFGKMKPHLAQNCALWRDNGGFCKPTTPEICHNCQGYEKKGRKNRVQFNDK